MLRHSEWLHRHAVSAGFVLMFAFTWPIDLWAAADSHGWTSVRIWPILPLLVGYGFVAASLVMTGILDGRAGIGRLLRQFLVWRIGLLWYAVVLLGAPIVDLAAIAVHVLLGGAVPDFTQPFARQVVGPLDLGIALPLFFLMGVFTNGEEIGWRGYATPRLQAGHTALTAALVVGMVSALWHVPKALTAGSGQDYPFWLFVSTPSPRRSCSRGCTTAPGAACGRSPCSTLRSTRPSCSCLFCVGRPTPSVSPRSRSVCTAWWRSRWSW